MSMRNKKMLLREFFLSLRENKGFLLFYVLYACKIINYFLSYLLCS